MRVTVVIWFLALLGGGSLPATGQEPKKGSVVVRLVGKGLLNQQSPSVLPTIQLGRTGHFLSIDGMALPEKRLKGIFIVETDKYSRAFAELVVNITDRDRTALPTLLHAVELLKQAAPAGVPTTIYVRW
jgi:hypothetical protein